MNKDLLIKQLSATLGKTKVAELSKILKARQFALRNLIDLTFYADKNIAFRAAWLLENVFLADPEFYITDINYLTKRIADVKYPSCQRHYAKIIMHITGVKAPLILKEKLQTIDLEHIVERLFNWMIDPKVKIAVKAFAAEGLFNLRDRYTWITDELANQLQFLMQNGSPAIQSKGEKLLKILKQL